ncbi:MAG: hypothetical protein F4Y01_03870 [Gammaproteobacteria bacterium]|nr:hypothetical protein [Gammaproteobacteria bacterium]
MNPNPGAVAELLAAVYGHEVDSSVTYPTGVAFSGRLRLATGQTAKGAVYYTDQTLPTILRV